MQVRLKGGENSGAKGGEDFVRSVSERDNGGTGGKRDLPKSSKEGAPKRGRSLLSF